MAIDLFPSLKELGGNRNYLWYDNLSDEDKKTAHPFVIGRWLTGTHDANHIVRHNAMVNKYMFSLGNEKPLLFKLLAVASTGSTSRYQWIKAPASVGTSSSYKAKAVSEYYEVSLKDANLYLTQHSNDDIIMMAEELGWSKDDLATLKKEIGNGSGNIKSKGTKPKGSK